MAESQKKPRIAFLTYVSRSGSTFLAHQLSRLDGVCVGIEARLPDGWIRGDPVRLTTAAEIDEYFQKLQEDSKFKAWGISMEALRQRLANLPLPLSFADVLTAALVDYAGSPQPDVIVHKCGHYITCMPQILREIPDARFIFVDRDPRAIYGSQKRSVDSTSGLPMQRDIVDFVLQYRSVQSAVNQAKDSAHVMTVRYESLMSGDLGKLLEEIAAYLGASALLDQKGSYYDAIPKDQIHLHARVSSGIPDPVRIDAWKRELRPRDIMFLDWALRPWLEQKGFEQWRAGHAVSLAERIGMGWHCLRYLLETQVRRRQGREKDWCA